MTPDFLVVSSRKLPETLKREGLRTERLQMLDIEVLKRAIAMYYGVESSFRELCFQARQNPVLPAIERFDAEELAVPATLRGSPVETLGEAVVTVARLGGWESYAFSRTGRRPSNAAWRLPRAGSPTTGHRTE